MEKRRIVSIPWASKSVTSHGIAIYALDTKRVLLVQRKHSPSLLAILRGIRRSDLTYLLKKATKLEVKQIYTAITENKVSALYKSVLGPIESLRCDQSIILTPYFKETIEKAYKEEWGIEENEWSFPKGRGERNESSLACALRELQEETGIRKGEIWVKNSGFSFIHKTDNYTYELIIYPAITFKEIAIEEMKDNIEVEKTQWMEINKVKEKINLDIRELTLFLNFFESDNKMLDEQNTKSLDVDEEKKTNKKEK